MSMIPSVDRSPEEKWQIVQEDIKSGNITETCRCNQIGGRFNARLPNPNCLNK
jgi:hypothetical protein